MRHLSGCEAGNFMGCTCHEIRATRIAKVNATRMNNAWLMLIVESVRFATWAVGEGIGVAKGEDAIDPEIFLYEFSRRTGHENWEELPDLVRQALALSSQHHSQGE